MSAFKVSNSCNSCFTIGHPLVLTYSGGTYHALLIIFTREQCSYQAAQFLIFIVLTGAYKFQRNRDAFFCAVIHCKACVNLHKCTGLLNRKEYYPVPLIITHLNTSALRR